MSLLVPMIPVRQCLRCATSHARLASTSASASTASPSRSKSFKPAKVRRRILDDLTSNEFLDCIRKEPAEPLVLTPRNPILKQKRTIIDVLLDDPSVKKCVVDLEVGRYDQPEGFQQVQLQLAAYLRWLRDGAEHGKMNGKQVYLAQWRGLEEMPTLRRTLSPPRFLQSLINKEKLDLYQASFFIGPNAAITPLHHDPYINLFHLASTSGSTAAKHFLILPPTDIINQAVRPAAGEGQLNTSPLQFNLIQDARISDDSVSVEMSETSPGQNALKDIASAAYGVSLRAGEMLLLPQKWWHRVENIGTPKSWTAGVGYWFRSR